MMSRSITFPLVFTVTAALLGPIIVVPWLIHGTVGEVQAEGPVPAPSAESDLAVQSAGVMTTTFLMYQKDQILERLLQQEIECRRNLPPTLASPTVATAP